MGAVLGRRLPDSRGRCTAHPTNGAAAHSHGISAPRLFLPRGLARIPIPAQRARPPRTICRTSLTMASLPTEMPQPENISKPKTRPPRKATGPAAGCGCSSPKPRSPRRGGKGCEESIWDGSSSTCFRNATGVSTSDLSGTRSRVKTSRFMVRGCYAHPGDAALGAVPVRHRQLRRPWQEPLVLRRVCATASTRARAPACA